MGEEVNQIGQNRAAMIKDIVGELPKKLWQSESLANSLSLEMALLGLRNFFGPETSQIDSYCDLLRQDFQEHGPNGSIFLELSEIGIVFGYEFAQPENKPTE